MNVLGTRTGQHTRDDVLPDEGPAVTALASVALSARENEQSEYENKLHELRASLAAVAGAARALEGDTLPFGSDARRRIERMLRAELDRLQRLTAPTSNEVVLATEQLDLDEIVESVVIARGLAGHEVAWNRTGLRVQGRRDEVVEILNILLTNAARHASGSPAYVDVRQERDQVRIVVSDEGPGVPEELRPAIFERGIKGPTGGQGIGLSVAKGLAGGLGGSLDLRDAEPDRGAVFEMKLPWGLAGGLA
jgi:signal transduction histidine kinase